MSLPNSAITCVDCGGSAYPISERAYGESGSETVIAYRCADCLDRWDLIIPDESTSRQENDVR